MLALIYHVFAASDVNSSIRQIGTILKSQFAFHFAWLLVNFLHPKSSTKFMMNYCT